LVLAGAQADFNVIKAFPKSNLGEGHRQELVPAGEVADFAIAAVTFDTSAKLLLMDWAENLGKNSAHDLILGIFPALKSGKISKSVTLIFARNMA
jgi:hypothetical protein